MKPQLILARTDIGSAALFVNQVVVAEGTLSPEVDQLVVKAAHQLSVALGVPLLECQIEVPDELDGKWAWSDLLDKLPPVAEQLTKHSLVVYCWQEGGVYPDSERGPGDAWDELCFDTEPPQAGTPYFILAPVHESSGAGFEAPLTQPGTEMASPAVDL